jgi:anti-anti-sigma factor
VPRQPLSESQRQEFDAAEAGLPIWRVVGNHGKEGLMTTHELMISALAFSDECMVIRVAGELDHGSERLFLDTLGTCVDSGHRYLVLDVSPLTFCDSRGLNCLFAVRWLLRRKDGELLLAGVGRRLAALLEQTGSTGLLSVHSSVGQALKAVPEDCRANWPPPEPRPDRAESSRRA